MEDVEGMETGLMMSVAVKILVFHQVSTDNNIILIDLMQSNILISTNY